MDFTKFVSMLENDSLFFCRTDLLDDPFEGSNSRANADFQPEVAYKDTPGFIEPAKRMRADLSRHLKWQRQWTFVNCWHAGEYESAAMWKLYPKSNEAICIQSTYETLERLLRYKVRRVEPVSYVDYETDWMPEGDILMPLLHKRKSFEHEKEVRAIIYDPPLAKGQWQWEMQPGENGRLIQVDLQELIYAVYVAPISEAWFRELVEKVIARYKVNKDVRQSSLDNVPVY